MAEPQPESARFFRATAMGGRFYMADVPDHGPWNLLRIAYRDEPEIDVILSRMAAYQKVRTVEELDAALADSRGRPGSISLYVDEALLGAAKERWEMMRTERAAKPGRDK